MVSTAPAPPRARPGPFVGLQPYAESDAAYFFGRTREQRIITANLRSSRLTLLYGPSGVGKSSVLNAGVVQSLRSRARGSVAASVRARPAATPETPSLAVAYFGAWREQQPLEALLECARSAVQQAAGEADIDAWAPGDDVLESLHAWTEHVGTLLLVLDQFEEYFLYHPQESGPGTWAGEFPRIVNDANLHVNFVVAIREDAWAKLDRFKGSVPHLFANYLRLDYLDRAAAREAIERPVDAFNALRPDDRPYALDPALADAVLDGVGATAAGDDEDGIRDPESAQGHIESPLLQLVMQRLWEATVADGGHLLSVATLDRLGGPGEIVRQHLARAMGELDESERAIAAAAFRFLVTSSKTKIAQRVSDLADWTGTPEPEITQVLERLADGGSGRILRPLPPPPGESSARYEIFHDVLAEPLLEWRKGYEHERETAALEQRLEDEKTERLAAEQARHAAQVNRLVRWSAVGLTLLAAGLAVAVLIAMHERSVARSRALAATSIAQLATDPELGVLLAREAVKQQNTPEAEVALREAVSSSHVRPPLIRTPEAVNGVLAAAGGRLASVGDHAVRFWDPTTGKPARAPLQPGGMIDDADMSADGRVVAVAGSAGAFAQVDGPPVRLGTSADVLAAEVSPDGRYVATVGPSAVSVWTGGGRRVGRLPIGGGAVDVAFRPGRPGTIALANCGPGITTLWDWRVGTERALRGGNPPGPGTDPCMASFSPDGRRLLTAIGLGTSATLWDPGSGRPVRLLDSDLLGSNLRSEDAVAWSADSSHVAVANGRGAEVFSRDGGSHPATNTPVDVVYSTALSPDGALLATASQDGAAAVWDTGTGARLMELRGHNDSINAVRFTSPTRVVTGSDDRSLRTWDVATGRRLADALGDVAWASFSPDGRHVVAASPQRGALVWPTAGGPPVSVRDGGWVGSPSMVTFNRTGARVIVAGETNNAGRVTVADAPTGTALVRLPVHGTQPPVRWVDISPDSRLAALATQGRPVSLWDLRNIADPRKIGAFGDSDATRVDFSPDGKRVVVAGTDGVARVFNVRTRRELLSFRRHTAWLTGAVFSRDGNRILSYGFDRTARVWDSRTGGEVAVLRGHTGWIKSGEFSPDGKRVVTSAIDATVRVWDAATGRLLAVERPHADQTTSASFAPHDGLLLTSGFDGTVKLGACDSCGSLDALVALAGRRVTRNLTGVERGDFLGER